jgi:hypothetical protein
VSNRENKKKGNKSTASASTSVRQSTQTRGPHQTQSLLSTLKEHPVFVVVSLILTTLVAGATIVPAAGYVEEKWQETIATTDFSGDIDQKKPFSVPLVTKNPSSIFAMHQPRISCWIDVEYGGVGTVSKAIAAADQKPLSGLAIAPGGTRNYFCDMPDNFTLHEGDTADGAILPVKQADMLIEMDYETWVPWAIERQVVTQFLMLQTANGFRWIKGDWIGPQQGVVWPPGTRPPYWNERPK